MRSARPGSSKPAPASKGGQRQINGPTSDDSDIEELTAVGHIDDADGEVVEIRPRTRKPPSRAEIAINGNEKPTTKGKGKARAVPNKTIRKLAPPPEPMEVDPIVIEEDEPGPGPNVALAINSLGKNKRSVLHTTRSGEASSLADQLRRVRSYMSPAGFVRCSICHIQQAEAQIAALSQQLDEIFHIRETEAEELLRRQEAQYQAQLQGVSTLSSR